MLNTPIKRQSLPNWKHLTICCHQKKITSPPKEELSNKNANRVKSERWEKIPMLSLIKRFQIKEYYQRQRAILWW